MLRAVIFSTVILLSLFGIGTTAFIYLGIYDIAASRQHTRIVSWILTQVKRQSVKRYAQNIQVPNLNDVRLIKRGFTLYHQNCVTCHGAPGEARSRIGIGVNPFPPPLEDTTNVWSDGEVAWIIANGLKMAGMPAFGLGEQRTDLWALTAFVKRINTLSPLEYRTMVNVIEAKQPSPDELWLGANPGWNDLYTNGKITRGRQLTYELGCGGCHHIPGITGAISFAGPPLDKWARRHYISGTVINNPRNLISWLKNPQQIVPGSAMPNLKIDDQTAWDIARFLYSLE